MRDQRQRCLMDDRKVKVPILSRFPACNSGTSLVVGTIVVRLAQIKQHYEKDRDRYQRALDNPPDGNHDIVALDSDVGAC